MARAPSGTPEPETRLAFALPDTYGVGAGQIPTKDDSDALQRLIDFADRKTAGLGAFDIVLRRRNRFLSSVTWPSRAGLIMPGGPGGLMADDDRVFFYDTTAMAFLGEDASFVFLGGNLITNPAIAADNWSVVPHSTEAASYYNFPFDPVVMRAAQARYAAFRGTGITLRGHDSRIAGGWLAGFDLGIDAEGARHTLQHLRTDCRTEIRLRNSGGTFTMDRVHQTPFTVKYVNGANAATSPVVAAQDDGGKLALRIGVSTTTLYPFWPGAGVFVQAGKQVIAGASSPYRLYRARNDGICGSSTPVHTSGQASDGGVTWQYKGTYENPNFYPDKFLAALEPGSQFFLSAPIADLPGGDILDPARRGRLIVQSIALDPPVGPDVLFGTVTTTEDWDASYATKFGSGCALLITPSSQPSIAYDLEGDGHVIRNCMAKGPRFGLKVDGSAADVTGFNFEAAHEGENVPSGQADPGNIAILLGPTAVDGRYHALHPKSGGRLFDGETSDRQPICLSDFEFSGADREVAFLRDGAWQIRGGGMASKSRADFVLGDDCRSVLFSDFDVTGRLVRDEGDSDRWRATAMLDLHGVNQDDAGLRSIFATRGVLLGRVAPLSSWRAGESVDDGDLRRLDNTDADGCHYVIRKPSGGVQTTGGTQPVIPPTWRRDQEVLLGDVWLNEVGGVLYTLTCTTPGETGTTAPTATSGSVADGTAVWSVAAWAGTVSDGTVTWSVLGLYRMGTGLVDAGVQDNQGSALCYLFQGYARDGVRVSKDSVLFDGDLPGLLTGGITLWSAQGYLAGRARTLTQWATPAAVASHALIGLASNIDGGVLVAKRADGTLALHRKDEAPHTAASTGTTGVRLTADGAAAASGNILLALPAAERIVTVTVKLHRDGGAGANGDYAMWRRDIVLARPTSAAGNTRVDNGGSAIPPTLHRNMGTAALDILADTTLDGLNLTVAGLAGVNATATAWFDVR